MLPKKKQVCGTPHVQYVPAISVCFSTRNVHMVHIVNYIWFKMVYTSVRNRCVIELFCGIVCVVTLPF